MINSQSNQQVYNLQWCRNKHAACPIYFSNDETMANYNMHLNENITDQLHQS